MLLEMYFKYQTLRKIPKFHLISLCGNFVERHSFRRVLGESPETLRKLCLSTKFPHHEISWNFSILRSENETQIRIQSLYKRLKWSFLWILAVKHFCVKLHLRWLARFWIRLCIRPSTSPDIHKWLAEQVII